MAGKFCVRGKLLLLALVAVVNATPVRREADEAEPTFYNSVLELQNALRAGHTISFTVMPAKCIFSTPPHLLMGSHMGFTTRHWRLLDENGRDSSLYLSDVHMSESVDSGVTKAVWNKQVLTIDSNGIGEYTLFGYDFPDPASGGPRVLDATPPFVHLGGCHLGEGIVAMDATGAKTEEMVRLGDYEALKTELLSGRQVEGWVDFTNCSPEPVADPRSRSGTTVGQGFAVESYFVENADKSDESITLASVWLEGQPSPDESGTVTWNELRVSVRKDGAAAVSSFTVNSFIPRDDAEGPAPQFPTLYAAAEGVSRVIDGSGAWDCPLLSGVRLFSRRFDAEKVYETFDQLEDELASGHKFHSLTYEGYCTDGSGGFAGNKVVGQILRTWEWDRGQDGVMRPTIEFYHNDGDADAHIFRGTKMTLSRTSSYAPEAVIGEVHSEIFTVPLATLGDGTSTTQVEDESESLCYLDASTFFRTPVDDGLVIRNIEELGGYRNNSNAIPGMNAVFNHVVVSTDLQLKQQRRRTSFDSGAWITAPTDENGAPSFVAHSKPLLTRTNPGGALAWLSYTMKIDSDGQGSLTKRVLDTSGLPSVPTIAHETWDNCHFQTTTPQRGQRKTTCTFVLSLNR